MSNNKESLATIEKILENRVYFYSRINKYSDHYLDEDRVREYEDKGIKMREVDTVYEYEVAPCDRPGGQLPKHTASGEWSKIMMMIINNNRCTDELLKVKEELIAEISSK
jgi:hypothetical protein